MCSNLGLVPGCFTLKTFVMCHQVPSITWVGYGFGLVGGMILGSGVLYVEVWCWKMIPSGSG